MSWKPDYGVHVGEWWQANKYSLKPNLHILWVGPYSKIPDELRDLANDYVKDYSVDVYADVASVVYDNISHRTRSISTVKCFIDNTYKVR